MTPRHLEIARGEVGVAEATGHNDGVPAERYMAGERLPWCAAFVLWCLREAGYPAPVNQWMARNVHFFEVAMKDKGYWEDPRMTPRPGDIFFLAGRDGSDSGPGRHMGFVEAVDLERGIIRTIEGNLNNRVARGVRSLRRAGSNKGRAITGYASPTWR